MARGELADFYDATQSALRSPLGNLPEDAARGQRLTKDVLDNARKILALRKEAAAADSTAKPQFTQFGATTMQALGGGYALNRSGGPMSQPIGAMTGTTPHASWHEWSDLPGRPNLPGHPVNR